MHFMHNKTRSVLHVFTVLKRVWYLLNNNKLHSHRAVITNYKREGKMLLKYNQKIMWEVKLNI